MLYHGINSVAKQYPVIKWRIVTVKLTGNKVHFNVTVKINYI